MGLNISRGNMYEFINSTWNTVKGQCYHDCQYCYMKRWGHLKPVRFDEKELKTDLGCGNFIFVGSSCDMFAKDIPDEWIMKTLYHCNKHYGNRYLFQTKNPKRIADSRIINPDNSVICTTLETNRHYKDIMRNSPPPSERAEAMNDLYTTFNTYITIEPIMQFDLEEFYQMLYDCNPVQVNIGSDSSRNHLPEPPKEKILELIEF